MLLPCCVSFSRFFTLNCVKRLLLFFALHIINYIARCYIDVGMNLLGADRWTEQYSLCLDLYEMSASVSCFKGDINTMSRCLHETIANVKCFEDGLTSSTLLAKLLAASSKYDEAVNNCLSILSTLGEEFPQDISLPIVLNELSTIQTTLANITVDQMKLLVSILDVVHFVTHLLLYALDHLNISYQCRVFCICSHLYSSRQ